jgi:flagellin-specific chaperone FliS
MKKKNKELMQRAIGIIEGVSFCLDSDKSGALVTAVEMLDAIVTDEEKERR